MLLNLAVIVPSLHSHLLVFTLQPLDRLLTRKTLVFHMSLCTLELLLGIRELLVDPLVTKWSNSATNN